MQDRVRQGGFHPSRHRLWPRHRKRLNFTQECNLNLAIEKTKCESMLMPGIPANVRCFQALCRWQRKQYGNNKRKVKELMYSVKHFAWLALYLAQSGARLDYKQAWNCPHTRSLLFGAWQLSKTFHRKMAARVQSKIERFRSTSPLTRTRIFYVRVQGIASESHIHVKKTPWTLVWTHSKEVNMDV